MGLMSFIVVTAVGGAAITVFPPLVVPVANMLGVGSTGVVAGGLAAGAQSYVGNLAAGCVLSKLQAAAMAPVLP